MAQASSNQDSMVQALDKILRELSIAIGLANTAGNPTLVAKLKVAQAEAERVLADRQKSP